MKARAILFRAIVLRCKAVLLLLYIMHAAAHDIANTGHIVCFHYIQ